MEVYRRLFLPVRCFVLDAVAALEAPVEEPVPLVSSVIPERSWENLETSHQQGEMLSYNAHIPSGEIAILQCALCTRHLRVPLLKFFHDLRIHVFLYRNPV